MLHSEWWKRNLQHQSIEGGLTPMTVLRKNSKKATALDAYAEIIME